MTCPSASSKSPSSLTYRHDISADCSAFTLLPIVFRALQEALSIVGNDPED